MSDNLVADPVAQSDCIERLQEKLRQAAAAFAARRPHLTEAQSTSEFLILRNDGAEDIRRRCRAEMPGVRMGAFAAWHLLIGGQDEDAKLGDLPGGLIEKMLKDIIDDTYRPAGRAFDMRPAEDITRDWRMMTRPPRRRATRSRVLARA